MIMQLSLSRTRFCLSTQGISLSPMEKTCPPTPVKLRDKVLPSNFEKLAGTPHRSLHQSPPLRMIRHHLLKMHCLHQLLIEKVPHPVLDLPTSTSHVPPPRPAGSNSCLQQHLLPLLRFVQGHNKSMDGLYLLDSPDFGCEDLSFEALRLHQLIRTSKMCS
jgi:hypothetical protein